MYTCTAQLTLGLQIRCSYLQPQQITAKQALHLYHAETQTEIAIAYDTRQGLSNIPDHS